MATSIQIGDSQPVSKNVSVGSLGLPEYTQAEVADATSDLNNSQLSGKRRGAQILMLNTAETAILIMTAGGPDTTDVWYASNGPTTNITPA